MLVRLMAFPVLALAFSAMAAEQADPMGPPPAPPVPKLTGLRLLPDKLVLSDARDARRVLVFGVTEQGKLIDVTGHATFAAGSAAVRVESDRSIVPVAEGQTSVAVSAEGHTATLPVSIAGMEDKPLGFVRDIEPILAKVGCNAGTCHGSAKGKEGFKLSLRGYDTDFDYEALVTDLSGRRFNRVHPDQSLMLLKPTGAVAHEGGKVLEKDSAYYKVLHRWIAEGTKGESPSARAVKVQVLPEQIDIDLPGRSQRVLVIAHYADGSTRDVTNEAVVSSNNIEAVHVKDNIVTGIRRGEGAVLIRYEGNYATREVTIMGDRSGFEWVQRPQYNYIDEHIDEKLKAVKVQPSELCTDAEFIRRVSLDLTGLPATPERVKAFLADPSESQVKRARLVDELLASEDFNDHWSNKWADLLQVNSKTLGSKGLWTFRTWIRDSVAANKPYDQFVRELLLAKGSSVTTPQVNYYRTLQEPDKITEDVSQTFLGIRFNCNKCHDHPFEAWTQRQYYEFGAHFARVSFKRGQLPEEQIVYVNFAGGEVKHPKTDAVVKPMVPYDVSRYTPAGEEADRRAAFVDWLTSSENPFFAKSMANRTWSYFCGRGIIDPVDDIRASNPPVNGPLLEALTKDFIDHRFDLRHLMRTICNSRTYQLSIRTNKWNEDDKINFSRAMPRRLSAEQLVDAIAVATGYRAAYNGLPSGTRAAELPDGTGETADVLGLFGKPKRQSACECERTNNFTLSHAINLVNGSTIGDAVNAQNSRIVAVVKANADDRKVVEELYYAILNRPPTEGEVKDISLGGEEKQRLEAAQDLAWALLNSAAFLYNR